MRFGLHLIRKVIKKKSFLIRRAYHSRALKPEQTEEMEGEGVREQGTAAPGGKAEGGRGRKGGRGQIRWDWFCHNVVQEAGGNAAAPKQRDAPAALRPSTEKTLIFPASVGAFRLYLTSWNRRADPFFKQSIPNCFFLVPGLSNRCS